MKDLAQYIFERNYTQNNKYADDPIKSAVWDYVAGYTCGINNDLRKNYVKKEDKTILPLLDKAFEKESKKLNVYRTVEWDYFKNIYGCTKENIDTFIGKEFVNKGYMSTASEFQSPWGSHWNEWELLMHITSDKEYSCIDVNKMFPNEDEIDCHNQNEILLPRNTKMVLKSYSIKKKRQDKRFDKDGTYVLEMEIQ